MTTADGAELRPGQAKVAKAYALECSAAIQSSPGLSFRFSIAYHRESQPLHIMSKVHFESVVVAVWDFQNHSSTVEIDGCLYKGKKKEGPSIETGRPCHAALTALRLIRSTNASTFVGLLPNRVPPAALQKISAQRWRYLGFLSSRLPHNHSSGAGFCFEQTRTHRGNR